MYLELRHKLVSVCKTYTLSSRNHAFSERGLMFELRAELLGDDALARRSLGQLLAMRTR